MSTSFPCTCADSSIAAFTFASSPTSQETQWTFPAPATPLIPAWISVCAASSFDFVPGYVDIKKKAIRVYTISKGNGSRQVYSLRLYNLPLYRARDDRDGLLHHALF